MAYIERDGQLSAGLVEEFVEFIFDAVLDRVAVLGTKEVEDRRRWHGARAASDRGRVVQAKIRQMKRHGDGRLVCKWARRCKAQNRKEVSHTFHMKQELPVDGAERVSCRTVHPTRIESGNIA